MPTGDSEGMFDGEYFEYPHCNSDVLHAPGDCYYCDQFPTRQAAREDTGIPFSPLESNGWSGNVAVKSGEVHEHLGVRYTVGDVSDD